MSLKNDGYDFNIWDGWSSNGTKYPGSQKSRRAERRDGIAVDARSLSSHFLHATHTDSLDRSFLFSTLDILYSGVSDAASGAVQRLTVRRRRALRAALDRAARRAPGPPSTHRSTVRRGRAALCDRAACAGAADSAQRSPVRRGRTRRTALDPKLTVRHGVRRGRAGLNQNTT